MNPWDIAGTVAGWIVALFVIFTFVLVLIVAVGVLAALAQGWAARLRGKPYPPLRAMPKPPEDDHVA